MKNVLKLFLLAALLLPTAALADNPYVVTRDLGGRITSYDTYWHRVSSQYDRVVIDGPCKSACTMVLGIVSFDRICITQRGFFAFHAAHKNGSNVKDEEQTRIVRSYYPVLINKWIDAHDAVASTAFKIMPVSQVTFLRH